MGPFVLMLYKIVSGDLVRFFSIYFVLVMGFSQCPFLPFLPSTNKGGPLSAFYVVYNSCAWVRHANGTFGMAANGSLVTNRTSIITNGAEALARMFIMSIGEFAIIYRDFQGCHLAPLAKVTSIFLTRFDREEEEWVGCRCCSSCSS